MIQIKFSHRYTKMPRDWQLSKLLDVLPAKLEDLSTDFLLYDTEYEEYCDGPLKDFTYKTNHYPLPKSGAFMILLLQAGSGHGQLWTTIRSQKGRGGIDKLAYYRSHIGELVECVVDG